MAAGAARGRRLPAGDQGAGTPARDACFRPGGHHCAYFDAKRPGYSGVAVLSKKKPDRIITGFGVPEFDDEGRYLEFQFGKLSVVSLYLPSGSSGPERQASKFRFLDAFLPHLKKLARRDRDYVLCGDINIAHKEIDLQELEVEPQEFGLPAGGARLARPRVRRAQVGRCLPRSGPAARPVHLVVEPRPGAGEERRLAHRLPDREPAARGPRARRASIFRDRWFSDHAPLTMDYEAVKRLGGVSVKPYLERESLAAFFVGVSSGFPYAMIAATLTTRLAQDGIDKRTDHRVHACASSSTTSRCSGPGSWTACASRCSAVSASGSPGCWSRASPVIAAVVNLALVDPAASIRATVIAAVLVGIAGATYDIVIDAYRIETLKPGQLGVGSGMSPVRLAHRLGGGGRARARASRRAWAGPRPTSPAPRSRCRR